MKKLFTICLAVTLMLCGCNKFKLYDGPDCFYFDPDKSSSINIADSGEIDAEYYVHYTGKRATQTNEVTFSISVGNGLKEGVDYKLVTQSNTLNFKIGYTDLAIRIKWLPHDIDESQDNTVTLTLDSVNNPNAVLGMPGPACNYRSIKIIKYKY